MNLDEKTIEDKSSSQYYDFSSYIDEVLDLIKLN